uniref:dolichyl-phosphate-mannose--protein mannosyltransferase n=1 Tax=Amphilophus citrinellus TaxID=61819 RepID=A0A3Q0S6Q8_AMPCI
EMMAGVLGELLDSLRCNLAVSVSGCVSEDSLPFTASPYSLFFSLLLGTSAMLVKETGITVFGVCLIYDLHKCRGISINNKKSDYSFAVKIESMYIIENFFDYVFFIIACHIFYFTTLSNLLSACLSLSLSHLSGSRLRELLYICSPFIKRASLTSGYVVIIMSVRLWLMGGSMPLFSEQDNPASFSPHFLTRFLTYSYLLPFNAWLLLAPIMLCYDWQVGSIPLVESLGDVRNVATLLLAVVMITLCLHCTSALQVKTEIREVLVGLLFLVFPFIPASNLFFRVGFVVAERVLYMPSMGYCILVAHGLGRLCSLVGRWGTTVLSVSMLLLVLLFSWKTVHQNNVWLSREALFLSGIQTLPHNAKVHYNYANFLKDTRRHQEAIHHYNIALRLYPQHASAMNNLGTLTRSPEEAEIYYRKALETNPQHNRALFNLGNLLKRRAEMILDIADVPKHIVRVSWEHLAEMLTVCEILNSHLWQNFNTLPRESEDIQSK